MTSFSEQAWQRTAPLRAAIDALPFNTELAAGTLSRDRFKGYIVQDALYLDQYGRALAMAGARGPDGATLRMFAESALEAVAVEQILHETYLRDFGVDMTGAEPSPDCLGYTSYLMATAYHFTGQIIKLQRRGRSHRRKSVSQNSNSHDGITFFDQTTRFT